VPQDSLNAQKKAKANEAKRRIGHATKEDPRSQEPLKKRKRKMKKRKKTNKNSLGSFIITPPFSN
jgi:hypothetical protein